MEPAEALLRPICRPAVGCQAALAPLVPAARLPVLPDPAGGCGHSGFQPAAVHAVASRLHLPQVEHNVSFRPHMGLGQCNAAHAMCAAGREGRDAQMLRCVGRMMQLLHDAAPDPAHADFLLGATAWWQMPVESCLPLICCRCLQLCICQARDTQVPLSVHQQGGSRSTWPCQQRERHAPHLLSIALRMSRA